MNDSFKSKREANIKLLQRRIEELAKQHQVQYSSEDEPVPDEQPPKPTMLFPHSAQNFNTYDENLYVSTEPQLTELPLPDKEPRELVREPKFGRPNNTSAKASRRAPEPSLRAEPEQQQVVGDLLRQLDAAREDSRQKDLKLETLSFRCEQLQNELSLKIDQLNKTNLELEEQRASAKSAFEQSRQLEGQMDQTKRALLPELQKLKSQNSVCLIELRSLENDVAVLEERIQELNQANGALKTDNREFRALNSKIEQERLQIKMEVEALRESFAKSQEELEDLKEQNDELDFENQRLKNELASLNQKIPFLGNSKGEEKAPALEFEKNVENLKRTAFEVLPTPKSTGSLFHKLESKRQAENAEGNRPISRQFDNEKLSFEGLNLLEERLKKIIK